MRPEETLIEMARRHVRESEEHVRRQREILQRLYDHALPVDMAEALLDQFEDSLEDHRRSVERIEAEQRSGVRDEAGELRLGRFR